MVFGRWANQREGVFAQCPSRQDDFEVRVRELRRNIDRVGDDRQPGERAKAASDRSGRRAGVKNDALTLRDQLDGRVGYALLLLLMELLLLDQRWVKERPRLRSERAAVGALD